jgi:hypothetical protein
VEWFQIAEELEFAGGMGLCQTLQKKTAEKSAENLDGKKEEAAVANPLLVVWGETAAGTTQCK